MTEGGENDGRRREEGRRARRQGFKKAAQLDKLSHTHTHSFSPPPSPIIYRPPPPTNKELVLTPPSPFLIPPFFSPPPPQQPPQIIYTWCPQIIYTWCPQIIYTWCNWTTSHPNRPSSSKAFYRCKSGQIFDK
jgi:hypothetical protein